MNPKVSVIIPTYNRAPTVGSAIDSVLSQTFSDLEVIVVDDGSSDNTGKILQETYGDRIRYFAQANQGAQCGEEQGTGRSARGEWIALSDSDDLWGRKRSSSGQFKALGAIWLHGAHKASYTDTRFFNYPETRTMFQLAEESYRHEGTMGINADVLRLLLRPGGAGMVVCTCSLLARADVIKKTGGFDPNLHFGEDSDFHVSVSDAHGLLLRQPSTHFGRPIPRGTSPCRSKLRVGQGGILASRYSGQARDSLDRLGDAVPWKVRQLIREQLGSVHSGWTNWYLETRQYAKAREAASRAAKLDLRFSFAVKWLLTWISPRLALRAVQRHQQRTKDVVPFV